MKIVGTGLSGLVGSRIIALLPTYSFENLSLETGVDITDARVVDDHISRSDASWVFHFAAVTDVDGAEKERSQGTAGRTWKVNVDATENIVSVCKRTGKKMLYISTDFVFDGTKESYDENDTPNPQGWYAVTKYEGEKRVVALGNLGLIIRIANPYSAYPGGKKDFVHKIIERLRSNQGILAPSDQVFVPTYIDDIALGIDTLLRHNAHGLYHVVGSSALSPYDAALLIAAKFGYDQKQITHSTAADYFAGRAPRPLHAWLKNDRITGLGVDMSTFEAGLAKVHAEMKK